MKKLTLILLLLWPCVTQAAPGDTEAEALTQFDPFAAAYRCPEKPYPSQNCEPGKWYFGTLLQEADLDFTINQTAEVTKWKVQAEGTEKVLADTKTLMQTQIDHYQNRATALSQELDKTNKAVRTNTAIAFGAGLTIGTVTAVAITAIVYQAKISIEGTVADDASIRRASGLRW